MRAAIVVSLLLGSAFVPAVMAQDDPLPVPPPQSVDSTTTTVEPVSPTTTSEFGTETEIEISLDDNGNIVPG